MKLEVAAGVQMYDGRGAVTRKPSPGSNGRFCRPPNPVARCRDGSEAERLQTVAHSIRDRELEPGNRVGPVLSHLSTNHPRRR